MSIIYGKNLNLLNETILIPVIGVGEKSSSHSRSDSNYEVLLPVIFVILFILVLFLVYAYNNLHLKQTLVEYLCCIFRPSRRRRRQWQYAQHYGPQYHHPFSHHEATTSQLQKSLPHTSMFHHTQHTFGILSQLLKRLI